MLHLHFAGLLLLGLLRGSHSQGPKRSCTNGCCLTVNVLQRHARPTFSKPDEKESKDSSSFDEVTVEFEPCDRVASMTLRLPERQQCEGVPGTAEASKCTGYIFRQTSDGGCYLKRSRSQALPSDKKVTAVDIVSAGHLTGCDVNNVMGDGATSSPTPKRSEATLKLQAPLLPGKPPWQFFTILVRNPPLTPTGKDVLGNAANSFQMVLKGDNGTVVGSVAFPAKEIRSAWFCSYSRWVLTSPCTAKCGGGVRWKVRKLLHRPPESYDPAMLINCNEPLSLTEPCNEIECDFDCELGDWVRAADGPCTASCGGGWEVWRRPVIKTASGSGKLCPHWSSPRRVKYERCSLQACEPRCEASPVQTFGNVSLRVETPCSEPCNGGVKTSMLPAFRKETGMHDAKCAAVHSSACNVATCKTFNLFPGKQDLLPWAGHWYDLSIVFFLSDLADMLELRPPKGFHLGDDQCQLIEHNLPRLKNCTVLHLGEGKQKAIFEFFNPLEAIGANGSNMYKVRIWVKHPTDCRGGVDPEGTCRGNQGERDWTLVVRTELPTQLRETITAAYEIYQPGAVPDVSRKVRTRELDKVTVTDKASFRKFKF